MAPSFEGAVAAIDCGTNSTRLLVVDSNGATLLRATQVTRLGEDVDKTGMLSARAIERTLRVLEEFREEMIGRRVTRARLVATSAVRDARNGEEFLRLASSVTKVRGELLTGDEEGRLGYRGATACLPGGPGSGTVVVDIGGGSTELVHESSRGLASISLPLGCVRLTERHLHHDPPTNEELIEVVHDIEAQLARMATVLPELSVPGACQQLIGLAGTVSTLAALEQGLKCYTFNRLHHARLSDRAVGEWCDRLSEMTTASRAALPSMVPGRAEVIVAGALALRCVMASFKIKECIVSEHDILDGLTISILDDTVPPHRVWN